ncbi:SRPBCC family protein [Cerasicoccus arenae]|uniref:Activator of Hsp90 ATPase homologue 1/2-like C-terminal domain-containing protein n=1 Tax=Cerasicoccus arenae TaxID=424488 RepID=A0A8J3DIA7_9BACT|nr:SRPBCC domain-containing protein [Cerasicoccus arenae]MBK1857579.1 SRPBCC domain-containing protein [Cerasicoccus arenae]GHC05789.1 hypothetical protein GCM10007047_23460 [Cerasicoccus arenae]
MNQLHFEIHIEAPKENVWEKMLSPEPFKEWTAVFSVGSYYEGNWEEGSEIRFLTPKGDGMISRVMVNRPYEFISLEHLGVINEGVVDTESPKVKAWAPAYENYSFSEGNGVTTVMVDIEIMPGHEKVFEGVWQPALAKLKEICEAN